MARMIFNDDHVPCLTTYAPSRCSGSADQMRGKVLSVPTLMKNHLPCEVLLLKYLSLAGVTVVGKQGPTESSGEEGKGGAGRKKLVKESSLG